MVGGVKGGFPEGGHERDAVRYLMVALGQVAEMDRMLEAADRFLSGREEGENEKNAETSNERTEGGAVQVSGQVQADLRRAEAALGDAQAGLGHVGDMCTWSELSFIRQYLRGERDFDSLLKLLGAFEASGEGAKN